MSEEMKMSDTFKLPVDCFVSKVKLNVGCSLSFLNVEDAEGKDHNKSADTRAIEVAINNHDRLTEENRKLREFATYINSLTNCAETKKSMELHSLTLKAKQLLKELK